MDKPTIFISYSHKDEVWKDRLRPHLQALELDDRIVVWDDRKIDAGDTWYPEIKDAINRARVAVCLISADFLASEFCVKEEIPAFLQRRETEDLVILFVLVHPCYWERHEWINKIQMLPRDGKSLSVNFKDKGKRNLIFTEIAKRIDEIIGNPEYQPPAPPAPVWAMPEKLDTSRLPVTGSELFGRQAQLELLDEAWDSAGTNIASFVAWGGVGKSTLVNKWLERLAKDNYRGAQRVYAWSFYSQGTTERATSADLFINSALEWFGDEDPTAGSPWDKGERLARLVRQHRTLLLLDGMEPLQSSNNFERGKIKDPALATLVTKLARENPGLCVITTREHISDLDHQFGTGKESDWVLSILNPSAARGADAVQQINLELLSPEAGRALLRVGGVRGTDEELERAAESFGCHALALNLLAVYLQDIPGHHVSAAAEIPDLDISESEGKHPRRMIAAFERKLGDGPELEVLRMLGLFDRPADGASLAALRKAPKIPDLTDHIGEQDEAAWLRAVQRLRKLKLIATESHHDPEELGAHPQVHEHFRQQLKRHAPDAWRAGNLGLYEHLTGRAEDFPDTLAEMQPLFDAITHGCAAGLYKQTFERVYWRRVLREKQEFSIKRLGAFGSDLSALNGFFVSPWTQPVGMLSKSYQAFLLNAAGVRLQAMGRLKEALLSMQKSVDMAISQMDWDSASTGAKLVSELHLTSGDLEEALAQSELSIKLADRNHLLIAKMHGLAARANILHQAGRLKEASADFQAAEMLQQKIPPFLQFLYSFRGVQYCELLLSQGQNKLVQKRATELLVIARQLPGLGLLDVALSKLVLGKSLVAKEQKNKTKTFKRGPYLLQQVIEDLRKAGYQDELAGGLLARAEWARVAKQFDQARHDLAEAFTIAERGEMRLHLADCYLEFARLSLATGDRDSACKAWETAKTMVDEMGYHRRDGEVAALAAELGMTKAE